MVLKASNEPTCFGVHWTHFITLIERLTLELNAGLVQSCTLYTTGTSIILNQYSEASGTHPKIMH